MTTDQLYSNGTVIKVLPFESASSYDSNGVLISTFQFKPENLFSYESFYNFFVLDTCISPQPPTPQPNRLDQSIPRTQITLLICPPFPLISVTTVSREVLSFLSTGITCHSLRLSKFTDVKIYGPKEKT